jgi:mRNA interferase YafQ
MLTARFHAEFKREYHEMKKRGYDMDEIHETMTLLVNEEPLPPAYDVHELHAPYAGKMECHIEDDWLLIYRISEDKSKIVFYRTGTHDDLFT